MRIRKQTLSSQKFAKQRRQRRRLFALLSVLVVLALFWGFTGLVRWRSLSISSVDIEGDRVTPSSDIQAIVEKSLDRPDIFGIFSRRNIFFYSRGDISSQIMAEWPRISSVSVATDGLLASIITGRSTLHVTIVEKQPTALWCGKDYPGAIHDPSFSAAEIETDQDASAAAEPQCYFMDNVGSIFDVAPQFSGDAFVRFYGQIEKPNLPNVSSSDAQESPIGSQYLDPVRFAAQMKFVYYLRQELGFHPLSVVPVSSNGDVDVNMINDQELVFNDTQNPDQVIQDLKAFVQNNPLGFVTSTSTVISSSSSPLVATTTIDYIDLRYGNDVYYKLK